MTNDFSIGISNDARKGRNESYRISNDFSIDFNLDDYYLIRTSQRSINVYIRILN